MQVCMNWDAVNFDWNQIRAFLATVEEGSLSKAAKVLGQAQPTVGRQVASLEAHLGLVLFERVGRRLELTPTGAELLDHVRAMRDAAAALSIVASGRNSTVEGHVRVSASDGVSAYVLPEMLAALRQKAPGIRVEVVVSNTLSDLQRREADIAIRHLRPEQPELIAKLVHEGYGRFYAARSYMDRAGRPATLAQVDFVAMSPRRSFIDELAKFGIVIRDEQVVAEAGNAVAMWELVRQGLGVGAMSDDVAQGFPDVEPAFPDLGQIPVPVWLTAHRELLTSPRIRLVFDFLASAFRDRTRGL